MKTSQPDRVAVFRETGFFVVPAFLDDGQRAELRRASDPALEHARNAMPQTGHSTPRISLLTEADPAVAETVAVLFASRRVCALLEGLALPSEPDAPRLRDVHYYHEQTKHDWDGDWHRDSQFGQPDPEAERVLVATTTTLHVRVALEDDDRLEIVPGSHARWDTPEELRIRKGSSRASAEMPNARRVLLRAGDACIFHASSIHRATYRRAPLRRTLDAVYTFTRPKVAWPR